ncbi:HPP family protein [Rhodoplanes sp. SY1]|uniref:HPP family protein n=1 Tax=Rhodoplanes sp. SY1 TaxID=3166646 RepID=UPI0038B67BC0
MPLPPLPVSKPERRTLLAMLAGAAGGGVAIALMELFAAFGSFPLFAVPFATSIVLVMGSPEAEPAQPRALIGGHLVSTLVGLLVLAITGPGPWAAALAVGLSIVAMQLTRTFHPPAGIDPLLVVANGLPWTYLVAPVGAGAVLLALFAWGWHLTVRRYDWPHRWW